MGNQQSSASVINDTVNKSLSNILMSSSSSCTQTNTLSQKQVFSNITADDGCSVSISNIDQTANQSPNFTCSSSVANSSDLTSKFKTDLDQKAAAQISNFTIGNAQSSSDIKNKLVNDITNNINISNVSTCVQDNFLKQSQGVDTVKASCPGYCRNAHVCAELAAISPTFAAAFCDPSKCSINISGFNQSAIQGAIGNCLSSDSNYQKTLTDAANAIAQDAKASNTGVDLSQIIASAGQAAADIIKSSQLTFIVIGIVIVIVLGIGAYFLLSGGSSNIPQFNYPRQFQQQFSPVINTPQLPPRTVNSDLSNINKMGVNLPGNIMNNY